MVILPIVLLTALGGRLIHIHASLTDRLQPRLDSQHRSRTILPARRGMIFDARGRVLAGSKPNVGVYADPPLLAREDRLRLAVVLEMSFAELDEKLSKASSPNYCVLKPSVHPQVADRITRLHIDGTGLIRDGLRDYPHGSLAAHVVGFTGDDQRGLEGVERLYDAHLRGVDGNRSTYVTASRKAVSASEDPFVPPADGGHVMLTLDSVIQEFTENALARHVEQFEAAGGVAIVMSPRTGEILALACRPTFSPLEFAESPADARRNIAITDPMEPGSTFKPFVASAALAAGVINTTEVFDCHQGQCYFGKRLLHDTKPHGLLTMPEIILKSSNIGMAFIGHRMGNGLLHDALRSFGFGRPTGIELAGEDGGILAPLEKWTSYSTSSLPMGQEISVTPLQLANAFCAIVNDGVLLKPRIIKAVLSWDGTVEKSFVGQEPVRRVLPSDVSRYFREEVLVRVVQEGSGTPAALVGYQVLGKTGTAQVAQKDRRGYEEGAYTSSFIGAAPASDPQVVVLVMIHRPKPSIAYYGRHVAAPAVGAILGETLGYLEIPLDLTTPELQIRQQARLVVSDD